MEAGQANGQCLHAGCTRPQGSPDWIYSDCNYQQIVMAGYCNGHQLAMAAGLVRREEAYAKSRASKPPPSSTQ
jgi:phosphoribosylformylglycinamidine (FGAM) synthase-like amidotransferase family enzyme